MGSYYEYAAKIAKLAAIDEGNQRRSVLALKDKKNQLRKEMQPEFDAVSKWIDEQMKEHGLNGTWLRESEQKINTLNARIASIK